MKPVLTPEEMGAADRRAIAAGTPESVLVARAGRAVAHHALRMLGGAYGRRVVVVCGKGNNGADGRVAASVLRARGVGVDELLLAGGIVARELVRAVERADLAIDAMYGTGFRGVLEGDAFAVARAMRVIPTLAVDIPSGVDGTTGEVRGEAVVARETITFAALKPGLLFQPGRACAGAVRLADIGIAPVSGGDECVVLDVTDLVLPTRAPDAHKWSYAAMVVGGSTGMVGAPLMASRAAARAGAGMVVCGLPGAEAAARASGEEIVTRALPATGDGALDETAAGEVLKDAARFRVLALGPGLGGREATQHAVRHLVAEWPGELVVDADGLNALAADPSALQRRHAAHLSPPVLTPHAGEYERLAGRRLGPDRIGAARELAQRLHSVVLLKGPGTVVADPGGRAVVNRTDGPGLATAGTGDVLTGVIAGLLAHGPGAAAAAASAAYVHGRAASAAGTGAALVATDLLDALPRTLDALRSGTDPWEE